MDNPFKKWLPGASSKKTIGCDGNFVVPVGAGLGGILGFGFFGAATATAATNLYELSSAVSVPINWIAEEFSLMVPVLENLDTGEIVANHPVLDLLNDPSPFYPRDLLFETLGKNFLITGEMYVIALGNINSAPAELQPITPGRITVVRGQEGIASSMIVTGDTLPGIFQFTRQGRKVRWLRDPLTEIVQVKSFNPRDNGLLRGQSPLVGVAHEVRQNVLGGQHNVSLLAQGGRVSLAFHFEDEDMSLDDFEATKAKIREQFGGAGNAGKIVVTGGSGKLSVNELSVNNKDMDFANLMTMAKNTVASQYRFPLALIDNKANTLDNFKNAILSLYDNAVIPLSSKVFGGLGNLLLPRFGEDPAKWKIVPDLDKVPALVMRRNEELKLRKEIGLESINELRAFLPSREPVDGGDQVFVSSIMVPLGEANEDFDEDPDDVLIPSEHE